jgi:hypothetical protein
VSLSTGYNAATGKVDFKGFSLQGAGERMRADKAVILAAVEADPMNVRWASEDLKSGATKDRRAARGPWYLFPKCPGLTSRRFLLPPPCPVALLASRWST